MLFAFISLLQLIEGPCNIVSDPAYVVSLFLSISIAYIRHSDLICILFSRSYKIYLIFIPFHLIITHIRSHNDLFGPI